jgi:hypothetical protein
MFFGGNITAGGVGGGGLSYWNIKKKSSGGVFCGELLQVVCCTPMRFQAMCCETFCWKNKREFFDDCGCELCVYSASPQ